MTTDPWAVMATAAMTSRGNKEDNRAQLLKAFGESVANNPLDSATLQLILDKIENEGGSELRIEAIGTACLFLAMTKVVDATGVQPISSTTYTVGHVIAYFWSIFS